MPLGPNTTLITSANVINVLANGDVDDVYTGTDSADAFVVASGEIGDDIFASFDRNDSIINGAKIFDGDGDGYIAFGKGGLLNIDRTSSKNAGTDSVDVNGVYGNVTELRYLGSKGAGGDAGHVYADSYTRRALIDLADDFTVVEGTVGSETLSGSGGAKVFLYDTALGLNLGGDTLSDFGNDDLLATTTALYDATGGGTIRFSGGNGVLDLSGSEGPSASDPAGGPGGQIDVTGRGALVLLGTETLERVTYYFYGTGNFTGTLPGLVEA